MTIETVAVIDAPHFFAGIVLHDDVVVEAAPIVGYMKTQAWNRLGVRTYCKQKKWTVHVLSEQEVER